MVDLDAAFDDDFLEVTVGEPEPQVPAHRQQDHLGREPVPGERRPLDYDRPTAAATRSHPGSLTEPAGNCQRNGAVSRTVGHGRMPCQTVSVHAGGAGVPDSAAS